jgi:hypothetical protein
VSERIKAIQAAVERSERCKATHVQSEPIIEQYEGEDVWGGVVEVFNLQDHPKAKRAYGWQRKAQKPGDTQYTVVLGVPPINSARDAVKKASIAAILRDRL